MRAFALACLVVLAAALPCMAQHAPQEMAGLRLGGNVKDYPGRLDMTRVENDIAARQLSTVALTPVPGYRSGYVSYGNCAAPGRIVRIKMNYADDSRGFHDKLLAALRKRYGEPQQWRGNPFGSLRVWKWSVKDKQLGDVSLILQYYSGEDDSFTRGNSLRIAAPRLLSEERACQQAKKSGAGADGARLEEAGKFELDYFLPH